jgi:hypothetical protein
MPPPNLLGRCRPTGELISSMWYSHSYPWDKSTQLPGQNDTHSAKKKKKKKLNNTQGMKRNTQQRGQGALSAPEKRVGARR